MSLKEEIENAIARGRADREKESTAQEKFDAEWLSRRETLLPDLKAAGEIMDRAFEGECKADRRNGSIFLEVETEGRTHTVTLSPDKQRKEIACSFDGGDPRYFPASSLTKKVLAKILSDFAYVVAAAPPPKGSVYESRGLVTFP